jgi:hypothetical protein
MGMALLLSIFTYKFRQVFPTTPGPAGGGVATLNAICIVAVSLLVTRLDKAACIVLFMGIILFKSWANQNFNTIETIWNTND